MKKNKANQEIQKAITWEEMDLRRGSTQILVILQIQTQISWKNPVQTKEFQKILYNIF